jgi:hypothetical protein
VVKETGRCASAIKVQKFHHIERKEKKVWTNEQNRVVCLVFGTIQKL